MNLKESLKLSYVPRWCIVPMIRQQTVADHSWRVAMIAVDLATRLGLAVEQVNIIALIAIGHDLDEVTTGDIPSPLKETPNMAVVQTSLPKKLSVGGTIIGNVIVKNNGTQFQHYTLYAVIQKTNFSKVFQLSGGTTLGPGDRSIHDFAILTRNWPVGFYSYKFSVQIPDGNPVAEATRLDSTQLV